MRSTNTQHHKNNLYGIYAITDGSPPSLLLDKVEQALEGGINIVQYRNKLADLAVQQDEASALLKLCQHYNVPLIINDNINLAHSIGADGVHLGKSDGQLNKARLQLGSHAIIGISCYNDINIAMTAEKEGADYVAFGSLFSSPTKPDAPRASLALVREAREYLNIPICCIGGVTLDNADLAFNAGADMVAVISSLFACDEIYKRAEDFCRITMF
ncbi:MAG: thiamine phosphate synthase [Thiotrichaceae bacterium]|nr:thiamine phosphate synthase [Thiotrichaceae bacterium]